MIDQGLLSGRRYGDLRDLIARRVEDGSVVSVGAAGHAAHRVPAHAAGRRVAAAGARRRTLVGVIDESDLLLQVQDDAARFSAPVEQAMTRGSRRCAPDAGRWRLRHVLDRGLVAIVADAASFHGLITRFDLLNHLRRRP